LGAPLGTALEQGSATFSYCGPVSAWHYFADRPSIK